MEALYDGAFTALVSFTASTFFDSMANEGYDFRYNIKLAAILGIAVTILTALTNN